MGISLETYQVRVAETMHVDVPVMGLAAATGSVAVTARSETARARLATD